MKRKLSYEALKQRIVELEQEVAELRITKEQLRETNALLEKTLASLTEAVLVVDPSDRSIIACNPAVEEVFGYSAGEIVGRDIETLHVKREMYEQFRAKLLPALETTGVYRTEYQMRRKDGSVFLSERTVTAVADDSGERTRLVSLVRDITDREQAVEALRETNELLEKIFSTTHLSIAYLDPDFNFMHVNRAYAAAGGHDEAFFVGKNHFDLYPHPENEAIFRRVVETGEAYSTLAKPFEYPDQPELGVTYWDWTLQPVKDAAGAVEALLLCLLDVTERVRAAKALHETKRLLESTLASLADAVFVVEPSSRRIIACNPALERIFGYSEKEAVGRNTQFLHVNQNMYEQFGRELLHALDTKGVYHTEYQLRRKDGSVFASENTVTAIVDDSGNRTGLVSIVRDITERKQTEEETLRRIAAIEQATEGIMMADSDGTVRYVNPAFELITGYASGEIIGNKADQFWMGNQDDGYHDSVLDSIRSGKPWSGHLVRKRKDGTPYEVETNVSPVRNKSGTIINYVTVERDVTHEARMERELRKHQKMEALGTLAGGVAHDFNNILMPIIINTELALRNSADGSTAAEYLGYVLEAARRGRDLVQQIIAFARQKERERKPVRIEPVVKGALKFLRSSLPATTEIRLDIKGDPSTVVLADPTQIHQVLMNLCTNAADAMRDTGGLLSVSLTEMMVDTDTAALHGDLKPGPYLRLTVGDTGGGMDNAVMDRIFEPFFTTKERSEGSGMGMGLAVVHGIVKNHGGAIGVYSEVGKGSTFNVFLPLVQSEPTPESSSLETIPKGKERILLVDDEISVARSAQNMLKSLGYQVISKTNSTEALEAFRREPEGFDLVITDQTMPFMSGAELAQELLRSRPGLPIILCTGFSEAVDEQTAKACGIREFVLKPFTTQEMAQTIRRVLSMTE